MMMPKEKKEIQKNDIMPLDIYTKQRKELRKNIVEFKKNRRISLGPYATFYFESYETMLAQVQEMLHIEKGGESQLKDELEAYNPLIPKGKELVATLMFEIDNPVSRADFLAKVGGIEEKIFIKIDSEKIKSNPEKDVDRTSAEGKASSVHFIHFNFSDSQIEKFKNFEKKVTINIDHELYNHEEMISKETRKALLSDFITLSASPDTPPKLSKIIGWKITPACRHRSSVCCLPHLVLTYSSAAPKRSPTAADIWLAACGHTTPTSNATRPSPLAATPRRTS